MTLDGFALLEEMFLRIAVQVSTRLAGMRYSLGNLSWNEVHKIRNLCHVPIEWMLLLDRSGSMWQDA